MHNVTPGCTHGKVGSGVHPELRDGQSGAPGQWDKGVSDRRDGPECKRGREVRTGVSCQERRRQGSPRGGELSEAEEVWGAWMEQAVVVRVEV